jgi:hypothetical protein
MEHLTSNLPVPRNGFHVYDVTLEDGRELTVSAVSRDDVDETVYTAMPDAYICDVELQGGR